MAVSALLPEGGVGFAGDFGFLVRRDDEHLDPAADPEMGEGFGDLVAQLGVVFADAGGEDDRLYGGDDREVGADVLADPVAVDVEREPGNRVTVVAPLSDFSHIAVAGQPEQAAATVESRPARCR